MTVLTIVSLIGGGFAAASNGATPRQADRLQVLGGTLLATGFLLLGAGLHIAFSVRV